MKRFQLCQKATKSAAAYYSLKKVRRLYPCRGLAFRELTLAPSTRTVFFMDKTKYHSIFDAFEKAPLEDFLKVIFKGITPEQRKSLIIEDVSFHRFNPDIVTLEAWMYMDPIESDQWIWVRVEKDNASGSVQELFYTKDSYRKQTLSSLQECLEYYEEKG